MKIDVNTWMGSNPNKRTPLFSYEVEKFNQRGFKTRLANNKYLTKKANTVKDKKDIFYIGTDLTYKRKKYKGGCMISVATILAARISIFIMAVEQLSKQIKNTLKEIK